VSGVWRIISLLLLAAVCSLGIEAQTKIPVWIDTDPSVERGGHEVDDGFALLQAFHSPELEIRGVSVVFGNAPLTKAWPIGKEIVERFGPKGMGVYRGAAGSDGLGQQTEASEALARSLQQGRLNILALGPVTNIATVLKLHPELAKNVVRIIAVAGRRPGQRFLSGPNQTHGFRDFNFELDSAAFQVLLDANVPIVLAPWELSAKVWMTREDLERLDHGGPEANYLVPPATDWLKWWHDNVGVDGFNPFDTLAVGYLTSPLLFQCENSKAIIELAPDDTGADIVAKSKPYLIISTAQKSSRTVTYCFSVDPQFKKELIGRLLTHSSDAAIPPIVGKVNQ
jgi:inosine-uridine nucleoside N-ribohydrolase